MDTQRLINATEEERTVIINDFIATASLEDVIRALSELTLAVDSQQELLLNLASMFTLALTDTMKQTGMITDTSFNEKYLANLDNQWDTLNKL